MRKEGTENLAASIESFITLRDQHTELKASVALNVLNWWQDLVDEYGPYLYDTMLYAYSGEARLYKPNNPNPWVPTSINTLSSGGDMARFQLHYEDLMVLVTVKVKVVAPATRVDKAAFQKEWIEFEDFLLEKRENRNLTDLKLALEHHGKALEDLAAAQVRVDAMFKCWWDWFYSKNKDRVLKGLSNAAYAELGQRPMSGSEVSGMVVKAHKQHDGWYFNVTMDTPPLITFKIRARAHGMTPSMPIIPDRYTITATFL